MQSVMRKAGRWPRVIGDVAVIGTLIALLTPTAAGAGGWFRSDPEPFAPHLAVGMVGTDVGVGGSLDLGARLYRVLATASWRRVMDGDRSVDWYGGRLDYVYWRSGRLTLHAGLGAGGLAFAAPGTHASGAAITGGAGVILGDETGMNLLGLSVELMAPSGVPESPLMRAPIILVNLHLNLFYLYALKS